MLGWLMDKIEDKNRHNREQRYYEDQKQKREKALPRINDLCRSEFQRFSRNPAIDHIFSLIFEGKFPVKLRVYLSGIKVSYDDDTSCVIDFRALGLMNLSLNANIFYGEELLSGIDWTGRYPEINSAMDKYPYLFFCQCANPDPNTDYPGRSVLCFDECSALGYLLAKKAGLAYERTAHHTNLSEFVFPTNIKKLKAW